MLGRYSLSKLSRGTHSGGAWEVLTQQALKRHSLQRCLGGTSLGGTRLAGALEALMRRSLWRCLGMQGVIRASEGARVAWVLKRCLGMPERLCLEGAQVLESCSSMLECSRTLGLLGCACSGAQKVFGHLGIAQIMLLGCSKVLEHSGVAWVLQSVWTQGVRHLELLRYAFSGGSRVSRVDQSAQALRKLGA